MITSSSKSARFKDDPLPAAINAIWNQMREHIPQQAWTECKALLVLTAGLKEICQSRDDKRIDWDPTPEQVQQQCEIIRRDWSVHETASRLRGLVPDRSNHILEKMKQSAT